MDAELLLEDIGLTKNEVKVYNALIDIGLTTTSRIIKKTGINTSKVYESLERLLKKGLVSYSIIKNKKHWKSEDPERIKDFLDEEKNSLLTKEKAINEILPMLRARASQTSEPAKYSIFEGIKGIKTQKEKVFDVLKKGDTDYIILANFAGDKTLEAYFLEWQKIRVKKGIKCRYIFNTAFNERGKVREKYPLTEARYVRPEILSPMWVEIFGDYVAIGTLNENPSVFLIKNKDIAKGFITYFEFLWLQGRK